MTLRLEARWLGRVAYLDGVRLQDAQVAARRRGEAPDALLLLEHPPVVTLGRTADPAHVLADEAALRRAGIERHECGRGGDVTYHAPGQLVGWPVVQLAEGRQDVHRYLRELEDGLIATLADFDIAGERAPGLTGVWVGTRKIAAIGVRVSSGWVTSHGFALNVTTDLSGFAHIVPCGISARGVTSMAELLERPPALTAVAVRVALHLARALGYELRPAADPAQRLDGFPRSGVAA